MGFIKKMIALVVLLIVLWIGYVAYALITANPQLNAEWGNVNEEKTQIVISGDWSKPLLIPINVRYLALNFSGVEVARTEEFSYGPLSTHVKVVVGVDNHNIVRALFRYLDEGQRGKVTVAFRGSLMGFIPLKFDYSEEVSENILNQMNFTAESRPVLGGLLQSPALVSTRLEWKGQKGDNGFLVAYMTLHNPNDFPLPVGNLSFEVYANGIKVGSGRTEESVVIPAKGYKTLPVEMMVYGSSLPKAWVIHVRNNEESTLRINLYLTTTVLGREVSLKLFSQDETVKTDIMESINRALENVSQGLSNLRKG